MVQIYEHIQFTFKILIEVGFFFLITSLNWHGSFYHEELCICLVKNWLLLKILQVRLQQYMDWELPDVQSGFRKGRGTRDQIANIHWITENIREFQENTHFCFIDYTKAFDSVDHNKLENF